VVLDVGGELGGSALRASAGLLGLAHTAYATARGVAGQRTAEHSTETGLGALGGSTGSDLLEGSGALLDSGALLGRAVTLSLTELGSNLEESTLLASHTLSSDSSADLGLVGVDPLVGGVRGTLLGGRTGLASLATRALGLALALHLTRRLGLGLGLHLARALALALHLTRRLGLTSHTTRGTALAHAGNATRGAGLGLASHTTRGAGLAHAGHATRRLALALHSTTRRLGLALHLTRGLALRLHLTRGTGTGNHFYLIKEKIKIFILFLNLPFGFKMKKI
jgi:hypothetical protein